MRKGKSVAILGGTGRWWAVSVCLLALSAAPAVAKPHEARVPVHDGKVAMADLSAELCRGLGVKPVRVPAGSFSVSGVQGSTFVEAVGDALGDGCRVTVAPDALVLHFDLEKLPKDCDAAKRAVRIFTAVESPEATAAQRRRFGLHLPANVDPKRPMVVLVHGLDSDPGMWGCVAGLLDKAGYQSAWFGYPADGPIDESAELLARHLKQLRHDYPTMPVNLVCHSMGGLVARAYVEGPDYAGGVDRLILCGTPNGGSKWARFRLALEIQEQYHLWRNEPDWHWTWMITDGLGEAGDDLKPRSKFLKRLNARPRRDGVRYTIVAGDFSAVSHVEADWVACTAGCVPKRVSGWWGFRHCKSGLDRWAASLRDERSDGDGPVSLKSADLVGVKDFVVVHADHVGLVCGDAPAAWPVILDRLGGAGKR